MSSSPESTYTASFNRSFLIYSFFVLLFIVPKFFNFYLESNIENQQSKWISIVVTDLLPFLAIATWAWLSARGSKIRTSLIPRVPDALLTLRFVACLMVMFGHYFGNTFPVAGPSIIRQHIELRFLMSCPWGGVWLFFGLSGYLMGKGFFSLRYPLNNEGIARYIRNRAIRILPIYFFGVLLVSLFQHPDVFKLNNLWILVQNLLLCYNGSLPININPVLWSVSTEFQFYLLAPFIAMLINIINSRFRLGYWSIIALIAAGQLLRYYLAVRAHWDMDTISTWVYVPIGSNLDLFVSGMLLAKIMQRDKPQKVYWHLPAGFLTLAALFASLSLIASYSAWPMPGNLAQKFFVFAPTLALSGVLVIIRLLDSWNGGGKYALSPYIVRWTQFGGILTYCLYIFHLPIMTSLRTIAPESIGMHGQYLYLPLTALSIFFFSYIFYITIEKPAATLKQ